MATSTGESTREFLLRREQELVDDIALRHRELAPLESELAEIRAAKSALGMVNIYSVAAEGGHYSLSGQPAKVVKIVVEAVGTAAGTSSARADGGICAPPVVAAPPIPDPSSFDVAAQRAVDAQRRNAFSSEHLFYTPILFSSYESLTIKQLVLKALYGHFPKGATSRQLREFFRDAWDRHVARESLGPQLSRLRQEGAIKLDGKVWAVTDRPADKDEAPTEDHSEGAPKESEGSRSRRDRPNG